MGIVFNIQRFSVHDGDGIRTVVFLKGCPLNCVWCHNPEGKSPKEQISYNSDKCIGCGECGACPRTAHKFEPYHVFERDKCTACGLCARLCPTGALKLYGREMSADEVVDEAKRDTGFYRQSGGGITLSGGEPLSQPDFALEILKKAKQNGIHTAVETCGHAPVSVFENILPYTDQFLFDRKLSDPALHEKYTGVSGGLILKNLAFLSDRGARIILRCPIIPGINDNDGHIKALAKLSGKYRIEQIQLQPYHDLGVSKHDRLGMKAQYNGDSKKDISKLAELCQTLSGCGVIIS